MFTSCIRLLYIHLRSPPNTDIYLSNSSLRENNIHIFVFYMAFMFTFQKITDILLIVLNSIDN